MINLYDIVAGEANTCEAFKDKRLYQAWLTLREYKIKWDDIIPYDAKLQWDKIGSDQIEEIEKNKIKEFLTRARRIKSGKYGDRNIIAFCFKDEKLKAVFNPLDSAIYKFLPVGGKMEGHWYGGSYNGPYGRSVTDVLEEVATMDYILVVYTDVNRSYDLRGPREQSRVGMWAERDEYDHKSHHLKKGELGKSGGGISDYMPYGSFYRQCENIAQEAMQRYKKIVAENKFKRNSDTTKMDNMVKDAMDLLMKMTTYATKHPDKISGFDLERIMQKVYSKYEWVAGHGYKNPGYARSEDGILVIYQKYCAACVDMQRDSVWTDKSRLLEERDKHAKRLETLCKNFVEYCAKYGVS